MGRGTKYSDEQIIEAVKTSISVMEVMRKIGMKMAGGSHAHLSKRIKSLELDTSHFKGQGHNKGNRDPKRLSADVVLVEDRLNGRKEGVEKLRRALHEIGREHVCEVCGQEPFWNGKPLVLQIDHINGDPLDNRRENLRWICPQCHSQTETFSRNVRHR